MKNAILIGNRVVNSDHITSIRFDVTLEDEVEPIHVGTVIEDTPLTPLADSPEGRSLKWWFLQADRVVLANPYRTIDLVALHEDATRLAAYPRIPGLERVPAPSRLHIGPARPCCRDTTPDLFTPVVAEACTSLGEGGAA